MECKSMAIDDGNRSSIEAMRGSSVLGLGLFILSLTILLLNSARTTRNYQDLLAGQQIVFDRKQSNYDIADLQTRLQLHFNGLALNNDRKRPPLVLKHFVDRKETSLSTGDIVLVTHASPWKFENLLIQLQYWNGPASVGVYIKSLDEIDQFIGILQRKDLMSFLQSASFHIVMERTSKLEYPFNIVRQVALETIESDYFLAMDVDFIPFPQDCHRHLVDEFSRIPFPKKNRTVFVLPAFNLYRKKHETFATLDMLPVSLEEVVNRVEKKEMDQFQKHIFPGGHGPTQTERWLQTSNDEAENEGVYYSIPVNKTESLEYEPYVVGNKRGLPKYWGDFRGFAYDKNSFFYELTAMGYRYAVLNNFFCVHLDHPFNFPLMRRMKFVNKPIWMEFLAYVDEKYYNMPIRKNNTKKKPPAAKRTKTKKLQL